MQATLRLVLLQPQCDNNNIQPAFSHLGHLSSVSRCRHTHKLKSLGGRLSGALITPVSGDNESVRPFVEKVIKKLQYFKILIDFSIQEKKM